MFNLMTRTERQVFLEGLRTCLHNQFPELWTASVDDVVHEFGKQKFVDGVINFIDNNSILRMNNEFIRKNTETLLERDNSGKTIAVFSYDLLNRMSYAD
jgi:hypothetical protein